MSWKITNDLINHHVDDPSMLGYGGGDLTQLMPFRFRLLDDDGEVYFYGISSDNNSQTAFEPLDWAMPSYGCTEIQYLNTNKKWETL